MNKFTYLCLLAAALAMMSGCSDKKNSNTYVETKADEDTSMEAAIESQNMLSDEINIEAYSEPEDYPEIEAVAYEDVEILPEVKLLTFAEAMQYGVAVKEEGDFANATYGSWYTVRVGDAEYFYLQDLNAATDFLWGFAIVGSGYKLANGITVGMSEEEICQKYPNVAIMNFDNTYISEERENNKGWDTERFPASWTDQFDYVIVARVEAEHFKKFNLYVNIALLMKDKTVAAITFNSFD